MLKAWPSAELTLTDDEGVLLITQSGISYRARGFRLDDEISKITDFAVSRGLSCLVRTVGGGHPLSDKWQGGDKFQHGSHSIPFSRAPDERWVFAIDQEFNKNRYLVFEKGWRHFIGSTGLSWKWEIAGGRNIFVPYSDFFELLKAIDDAVIDQIEESRRRNRARPNHSASIGVTSEQQLQELIIEHCADCISTKLRTVYSEFRNASGRADVILLNKARTAYVLELKKGLIGESVLQQVDGYLESLEIRALSHSAPLGIVVASEYTDQALRSRDAEYPHLALYRYTFDSGLTLSHCAGPRYLDGSLIGDESTKGSE